PAGSQSLRGTSASRPKQRDGFTRSGSSRSCVGVNTYGASKSFCPLPGDVHPMEIDITAEEENPMLHRTDVRFELIHYEQTAARLSVRDSLAARLDMAAGEVVILQLDLKFGMRRTLGYAKVYDPSEDANAVEQAYVLERNKSAGEDGDVEAEAEEA